MRRKKVLFLSVALSSILLTSCGIETYIEKDDNTSVRKDISSEENSNTTSLGDNQDVEYDEVVSVVDEFWKAKMSLDVKNIVSCCTGSYKKEVNKKMKEIVSEREAAVCQVIENYVEWAQEIFYECAQEYEDLIDASYLYEDTDIYSAVNEMATYMISNSASYSLPQKAKKLSKNKATVTMHTFIKNVEENDKTLLESGKEYIRDKVFEGLVDDAGVIKKAIAKEMMKQAVLENIRDIKKRYQEADEIELGTRVYYLKKKKGKWFIYKVVKHEKSLSDNSDEEDYYDDEYEDYYEEDEYAEENNSSYILENSDSEYLTEDDLLDLSSKELTYARNEIYARHGYVFKSSELNNYFGQQDWYEADYEFDGNLDDVEKYNVELILSYQNEYEMTYTPK